MTDNNTRPANAKRPKASRRLEFEYRLDAPREKVWRAISIAKIRESWLPGTNLRNAKPIRQIPGEEVTYQMRDPLPPYLESVVTFHLVQTGENSTCLRIVHQLTDARCLPVTKAANSNNTEMMCAA